MTDTPVRLQPDVEETLEAMESVAQGKVVSGAAVHTWLRSWGATDELPPPKVGE